MFGLLDRSDAVAVRHQAGSLTFDELRRLIGRVAAGLDELGLEPGDRVATVLPNSLGLLVSYYACLLRGLVIVPINERLTQSEVGAIVAHSRPRCLITTPARVGLWEATAKGGTLKVVTFESLSHPDATDGSNRVAPDRPNWSPEHPAVLFYTSGSTGAPKGVLYSHETLLGNCRVYGGGLEITAADHSVLCHCMSTNFVFAQLTVPFLDVGATVEIVDFGSVPQTLDAIERGATFLSLIPWFGFALIEGGRTRYPTPNRLRVSEVGGDRVPGSYFEGFQEVFGLMPREHLGMAEANTYVVNPPSGRGLRTGSVGLPLPEVQIEVRDPSGQRLPVGVEGQIWVSSPANMAGYWEDAEATRATMIDGWVATGDAGYLDEDGYLWFSGRIKQIIICDGDNIHPAEIELHISRHPSVKQACVVGLPHPTRGETVAAAVILRDPRRDVSAEELAEFLDDRLAGVKIPRTLLVLERFPETPVGKLDRTAIAARLLDRRGRVTR